MQENHARIRLNKLLSSRGYCSRRKADELIASGSVVVNGETVTKLGTCVDPKEDKVSVNDRIISRPEAKAGSPIHLALHKPVKVLTTLSDPQQRRTVNDLLPASLSRQRVLPAGRLDYLSEGLLLMSTDGEFLHKVTHPSFSLPKIYRVKVQGNLNRKKLQAVQRGLRLDPKLRLAPTPIKVLASSGGNRHWLEITLHQGINRQIRRMCKALDWKVLRLVRAQQGPITLQGLPAGDFRHLAPVEIEEIWHWAREPGSELGDHSRLSWP